MKKSLPPMVRLVMPERIKRQCGDCQLCCKLLPVHDNEPWRDGAPIDKPSNVRCPHQRHGKGCAIYDNRPHCCRVYYCRWLLNDDAADLPRPDRAHYVLDMMPDEMGLRDDDTGEVQKTAAVVIWVDPAYRDEVMQDKRLRAWIERKAAQGFPTLLRFNEREAVGVFAPSLSADGEWHFKGGKINPQIGFWNKRKA